jgi:hypothetical protein
MPPSVCFICTAAPSEPVCDTFLDFDPGVLTPRNGRIYVCASCASTTADALGLFDEGKQRVIEAEAKVTAVEKLMEAYADIRQAIEVIAPPAPAAPEQLPPDAVVPDPVEDNPTTPTEETPVETPVVPDTPEESQSGGLRGRRGLGGLGGVLRRIEAPATEE